MINYGVLEYYIASNSGFLSHYLGIIPVLLTWLVIALGVNYIALTLLFGLVSMVMHDTIIFLIGLANPLIVLVGYSLILGGTVISSGVTGFVFDMIGFILPIATGGMSPLSKLPEAMRNFALLTPFSYLAELIRYGMLGWTPVLDTVATIVRGYVYGSAFLTVGILYFKYQYRKILREGVRAAALW